MLTICLSPLATQLLADEVRAPTVRELNAKIERLELGLKSLQSDLKDFDAITALWESILTDYRAFVERYYSVGQKCEIFFSDYTNLKQNYPRSAKRLEGHVGDCLKDLREKDAMLRGYDGLLNTLDRDVDEVRATIEVIKSGVDAKTEEILKEKSQRRIEQGLKNLYKSPGFGNNPTNSDIGSDEKILGH